MTEKQTADEFQKAIDDFGMTCGLWYDTRDPQEFKRVKSKQAELEWMVTEVCHERDEAVARLDSLNTPGTLEAIIQRIWTEAERRGHSQAASKHALTFLLQQLDKTESDRDSLRAQLSEAHILLRSVINHARRYHDCNDGPFDMADNFLAGRPYKEEEPII